MKVDLKTVLLAREEADNIFFNKEYETFVHGVGISKLELDSPKTDDLCVMVSVSDLKKFQERFRTLKEIRGIPIRYEESPKPYAIAKLPKNDSINKSSQLECENIGDDGAGCSKSNCLKKNTSNIIGGMKIVSCQDGTLGYFYQSKTVGDTATYLLSNHHVLFDKYTSNSMYSSGNDVEDKDNNNFAETVKFHQLNAIPQTLAHLSNSSIFINYPQFVNKIDAAIANVTDVSKIQLQIHKIGSISGIFSANLLSALGKIVMKHGNETCLTLGKVISIYKTLRVSYGSGDDGEIFCLFKGQIEVESNKMFLTNGDSGSMLVLKIGGNNKILGLLFAAGNNNKKHIYRGYANNIKDVLASTELNINPL